MIQLNQVNATFDDTQIAWIDKIARQKFHMTDRGAKPHVLRVCVDLVRQFGFAELESLLAKKEKEQSNSNQPVSNTG